MQLTDRHKEYWRKNMIMTAILLVIWFVVTYVVGYFARELNEVILFGFPVGFYMGAQGALVIYVIIIFYYTNAFNSAYFPINSNKTWDNKGTRYKVKSVIDEFGIFDGAKYEQYSPPFLSASPRPKCCVWPGRARPISRPAWTST